MMLLSMSQLDANLYCSVVRADNQDLLLRVGNLSLSLVHPERQLSIGFNANRHEEIIYNIRSSNPMRVIRDHMHDGPRQGQGQGRAPFPPVAYALILGGAGGGGGDFEQGDNFDDVMKMFKMGLVALVALNSLLVST
ncbi:GTP-binding protein Rit1-like protein [Corchorus olitorius]|uniref:GTP-binding protein Rit1-like protein n=1 Tax=Corchorus olitorius TaxID=93759 RepID=A0A1R3GAG4_9ROSI|nr:GTP-binding protein Rit1-like protein [Corchorus olitorius]